MIFWINLPVAALGDRDHRPRRARVDRPRRRAARIDCPGPGGAQRRPHRARPGPGPVAGLERRDRRSRSSLLGVASLYAFWRIEHRVAEPIVDFALFRNGPYFGASAAAFALVGAYWCVMFFQSQYLQDVRGHSAVLSGLLILPITVPMIFISPLSGRLIARFGARRLMTVGHGLRRSSGLLVLTQVGADSPYALLLAGYLPFGVALGLVYAPMSTAAMAAMPAEKVGIASGVLAMDRVLAGHGRAGRHRRPLARPARAAAAASPPRSPARPGSWSRSARRRRRRSPGRSSATSTPPEATIPAAPPLATSEAIVGARVSKSA